MCMYLEFPTIQSECASPTIVARPGDNITLACPARGAPAIEWVWFRGEQELATGGRVTLLDQGARLSISMVRTTDDGVYSCTVSNEIDGVTFNASYAQRVSVQSEYMHVICNSTEHLAVSCDHIQAPPTSHIVHKVLPC